MMLWANLVTRVVGVLVELHFHFGEFINFCSKFLVKMSDGVVEAPFLGSRGELELGEIIFDSGYLSLACYQVACDNLEITYGVRFLLGSDGAGILFSTMFMKLLLCWGEKFLMYLVLNGVSCIL